MCSHYQGIKERERYIRHFGVEPPPKGEVIHSYTMLTINADDHPLMRPFHKPTDEKRMVVVLPENSYDAWLRATPGQQMEFMRPIRAADLQAIAVESATAPVKQAFDAGVNFIDTANVYSVGESETLTGNAIKSLGLPRDELVVATKATGDMNETAVNSRGQSRYHLMNELDASLKRLQLDHIDLYQLHGFDPLTPREDVLSTLNDMVRSGKARYIGLCNMAAWQIMKGLAISEKNHWARFESVQAYYTVAGRDLEREVLPLLQDQQLGLMVWSPLVGGLLSGKFSPDGKGPQGTRPASFDFPVVDKVRAFRVVDAMRPIAQHHQVSVAQVALAWLLSRKQVSTVIIGAKTPAQLEDNLGATKLELNAEDLKALDEVSALPPEYPGWMLVRQGQSRAAPPVRA